MRGCSAHDRGLAALGQLAAEERGQQVRQVCVQPGSLSHLARLLGRGLPRPLAPAAARAALGALGLARAVGVPLAGTERRNVGQSACASARRAGRPRAVLQALAPLGGELARAAPPPFRLPLLRA